MSKPCVFELRPDQAGWGKLNSIEATHTHTVPGMRCPTCGAWATTGVIYPCINESALGERFLPSAPVTVEEFRKIAADLEAVLGSDRPISPGTDLGHLRGSAKGNFGDFAWVNAWTPLLRESVWELLKTEGIKLCGVRAELDFKNRSHELLFELEAKPCARLEGIVESQVCEICGREAVSVPDRLVLDAAFFDDSVALQRVRSLPTILIVNEAFSKFIQDRRLRDVILVPVELR